MNSKDLNFAYKVRNALNENLDNLPASTAERLASARKIALSRKKVNSPMRAWLPQVAFAGNVGSYFEKPSDWLGRMGLAVPAVVLIAGLMSIYQFEQQERISETAELDAAVLADELPLSAYLDHGFNAYLAKPGE
ncbi:MAG: DNA-directed polymerase specialized sigma subunit [Burkholderia sp.]|jgi:hypothetical protein|nr:DNA-directed polymerase specialized sigma subunit [Burkholderia sp.]